MVLNIKLSKAFPERAIQYAVGKNLLDKPIKRNLFCDEDSIKEMRETAEKYGKWTTHDERKTFSMIISPNPKDNPTEEQVIEVSEAVLDKFFPTIQGFLVLHKDRGRDANKTKPILHSHFYGSVIDPITGKNIHLPNKDINEIRAWADNFAHEHFGWSIFERGKRSRNSYRNKMMREIVKSGHSSWMRNLTMIVEEAYNSALSFSDFERRLRNRGISPEYPDRASPIRLHFDVGGKEMKVNATSISSLLSWEELSKKFTELKKEDIQYGFQGHKQRNQEKIQMGAGFNQRRSSPTTGSGTRSGQGSVGSNGRKINYGCIICSRDKDICHKCTEFKNGRGGYSHGSRTR
ncbi:MAG: relaxase/mobilization nuclease domain-containing protein [Eubacteriaceae bacterium]|nr:relaxase/mobilization nuclease domain-containing protein [Eubacteriaceae bacterium]